jgi:hypothetical protein
MPGQANEDEDQQGDGDGVEMVNRTSLDERVATSASVNYDARTREPSVLADAVVAAEQVRQAQRSTRVACGGELLTVRLRARQMQEREEGRALGTRNMAAKAKETYDLCIRALLAHGASIYDAQTLSGKSLFDFIDVHQRWCVRAAGRGVRRAAPLGAKQGRWRAGTTCATRSLC